MGFDANSEKKFPINGNLLHFYFYSFNKSNPYLLMLHGLRSDTQRMVPIIDLIKERYNVISLDLPGFGNSRNVLKSEIKNENYVEYCAGLLPEIMQQLELKPSDLVVVGISNGANIILHYLKENPETEFLKTVLFAPIYSYKFLSMSWTFETAVNWLVKQTSEERWAGRLVQRVISSDKLFNFFAKLFDKKSREDKEVLDYERSQWRLMSMQHWGKTLQDFLEIDYLNLSTVFHQKNIIFIYPYKDQYLDVERTVEGFRRIFPNADFRYYDSKEHIPRGNYIEDEKAGESIKRLVENI